MTSPRTRRSCTAAAVLLAATLSVPLSLPATAATAPQDLQLSGVDVSADGVLGLAATVPAALSAQELPESAFTATQDGRPLPVTVRRTVAGPLELVVAVDTSRAALDLAAEQSAVADLLRGLPSQTPTTVLPGGDRTTARSALDTVAGLTRSNSMVLADLPDPPSVPRFLVVLAGCPALDSAAADVGPGTQVSVLALDQGCEAAAARLAGSNPGVVRTGLNDVGGLTGAVDEVSRSIRGQYVLRTEGAVGDAPVEVTVRAGALVASATTALPTAQTAPSATGTGSEDTGSGDTGSGPPTLAVLLAAALAVAAAAALGAELLARARSA